MKSLSPNKLASSSAGASSSSSTIQSATDYQAPDIVFRFDALSNNTGNFGAYYNSPGEAATKYGSTYLYYIDADGNDLRTFWDSLVGTSVTVQVSSDGEAYTDLTLSVGKAYQWVSEGVFNFASGAIFNPSTDSELYIRIVGTGQGTPKNGTVLTYDTTTSKFKPADKGGIENNRVETFTYEVTYYGNNATNPASPGDATIRTSSPMLWRFHEKSKEGKDLLLPDDITSAGDFTVKRNGTDTTYTAATAPAKQGNYFQFNVNSTTLAVGDTLEFTFTRPVEGDYAALKADLTSYETINGDVVRDIKPNDRLLTASSTQGHVYDTFIAGAPGSPTGNGEYAVRYTGTGDPLIRIWPNDKDGNVTDLHNAIYTGAIGGARKPFFYAWADGVLYKIPITSNPGLQAGYVQWYCAGAHGQIEALQAAGSIRLVLPWEAYEDPQDGDVLTYDSTNKTYHPKAITLASDSLRTLLGIDEYADDTAAGTGGLSSGELYYNTTSSSYVLKT